MRSHLKDMSSHLIAMACLHIYQDLWHAHRISKTYHIITCMPSHLKDMSYHLIASHACHRISKTYLLIARARMPIASHGITSHRIDRMPSITCHRSKSLDLHRISNPGGCFLRCSFKKILQPKKCDIFFIFGHFRCKLQQIAKIQKCAFLLRFQFF